MRCNRCGKPLTTEQMTYCSNLCKNANYRRMIYYSESKMKRKDYFTLIQKRNEYIEEWNERMRQATKGNF